jgi:hypothetical protein
VNTVICSIRLCSDLLVDYRVGRIRAIFQLREREVKHLDIPKDKPLPSHLAYVEWFTPFPDTSEPHHRQYKLSYSRVAGGTLASVVDVSSIVSSIHLLPRFGRICERKWTSSNVLDKCTTFYVNSFGNHDRDIHDLLSQ